MTNVGLWRESRLPTVCLRNPLSLSAFHDHAQRRGILRQDQVIHWVVAHLPRIFEAKGGRTSRETSERYDRLAYEPPTRDYRLVCLGYLSILLDPVER